MSQNSNRYNILKNLAIAAGVLLLFLLTRLGAIDTIPIFIDEAIHIESARDAVAGHFAAGLKIGKWLSIQSLGLFLRAFSDSLFSARFLIVLVGLANLILLFFLGGSYRNTSSFTRGIFSALLYVLTPYALFYDRLALVDQFQTLLLAFIIFFSIRITRRPAFFDLATLCLTLTLAPLFKFSGAIFGIVPILIVIQLSKAASLRQKLLKILPVYLVYAPLLILFGLRYAPHSEMGKKMLQSFSGTDIWSLFAHNCREFALLCWKMLTPGLCLLLVLGFVAIAVFSKSAGSRKYAWATVSIMVVLLLPFMIGVQVWFPRYFLPVLIPVCMLGGQATEFILSSLQRCLSGSRLRLASNAILLIFFADPAVSSVRMMAYPQGFNYYKIIELQYFSAWPSGYGLKETVSFLRDLSEKTADDQILVLRSSRWDHPLHGLDVYQGELGNKVTRLTLQSWNINTVSEPIDKVLTIGKPTYLLFNKAYPYPGDKEIISRIKQDFIIHECRHFLKPGGKPGLCVWRLENSIQSAL